MATFPLFRRFETPKTTAAPAAAARASATGTERDPFALRALPGEDLYFHKKTINNSRLVRQPDPQAQRKCWNALGATALVLVFLIGVLAPSVTNTLAGYRLEDLRGEERRLLDESRALDLQEAELLRPDRLELLARKQNLVTPKSDQVVRLNNKSDAAVAMIH